MSNISDLKQCCEQIIFKLNMSGDDVQSAWFFASGELDKLFRAAYRLRSEAHAVLSQIGREKFKVISLDDIKRGKYRIK